MKLRFLITIGISLIFESVSLANTDIESCSTSYRPKTNEMAFAAVGSSLKIADKTCFNQYLMIPFDIESGGVVIPQGDYKAIFSDKDEMLFATKNSNGGKAHTCYLCDPIDVIKIYKSKPTTLCVKSSLKIESCALDNSLSYTVSVKSHTTTGLCAPSLVYYGREGNTLKFAINDCTTISKPTLSYDLSLGDEIRFLDEQIRILKADNQGIFYTRMDPPTLKDHDDLSDDIINEILNLKNGPVSNPEESEYDSAEVFDIDSNALNDESKEAPSTAAPESPESSPAHENSAVSPAPESQLSAPEGPASEGNVSETLRSTKAPEGSENTTSQDKEESKDTTNSRNAE